MKKIAFLFSSLAVLFAACQNDDVAPLDATAKANAGSFVPAQGQEADCATVYALTAGQHIPVGTVAVSNDADYVYVTYTTTEGWYLTETHTYAGSCAAVPKTRQGTPVPGQFPDHSGNISGATTYTAQFAYSGDSFCMDCILAHAAVAKQNGAQLQTETAWGGDQVGAANRWYYYISGYCVKSCESEALQLRTQTQGGWGSSPSGNNPGAYLHANFEALNNGGAFTVGIGHSLSFTSAQAITNFLPQGGTAAALAASYTDPADLKNVFAGQVVALKLSVTFDNNIADFGESDFKLADAKVASGPYAGKTVAEILEMAEIALGGGAGSIASLNEVVDSINNSFIDGTASSGFLTR
jgi:hypothetical protein